MASIGNLVTKMQVDQTEYISALESMYNKASGVAGKIGSAFASVGSGAAAITGIDRAFANASFAVQKTAGAINGVASGLKSASKAASAFTGAISGGFSFLMNLPNLASSPIQSLFGFFTDADSKFSQIAAMGKLSDRLGVSTEFVSGLASAGIETDSLERAMRGLSRRLGNVHLEGEDVVGTFEKFGLSTEDLKAGGVEGAINKIADAYQKLPPGIQRASLAQMAGFRNLGDADRIFSRGSAGIQQMIANGEKLGLVFSRADSSKIEQGQRAVKEMGLVFEGMKTQLAIGVAPYISAIAVSLKEWITSGGGISGIFRQAGKWAGEALLVIADGIEWMVNAAYKAYRWLSDSIGDLSTGTAAGLVAKMKGGEAIAELEAERERHRTGKDTAAFYEGTQGQARLAQMREEAKIQQDMAAEAQAAHNPRAAKYQSRADKDLKKIKDIEAAIQEFGNKDIPIAWVANFGNKLRETKKRIDDNSDAVERLKKGFAADVWKGVENDKIAEASKAIDKLYDKLGKDISGFGKSGAAKEMDQIAESANQAREATERLIDGVNKQVEEAKKKFFSLAKTHGPSTDEYRNAQDQYAKLRASRDESAPGFQSNLASFQYKADAAMAMGKQLQAMETIQKANEKGKSITESMMTPMEKLGKEMDDLSNSVNMGAITWETYERASKAAGKTASDAMDKMQPQSPKAILRGSAEEFSMMVKRENEATNPNRAVVEKLTEQQKLTRQNGAILKDGLAALLKALSAGKDLIGNQ